MSMLGGEFKAETYNGLVFWRLEPLRYSMACHDFSCNGVVLTVITVFDTLVREFIVRWFLMSAQQVSRSSFVRRQQYTPIRAFSPSFTFALDEERTYMWSVTLVVGIRASQLLQHLLACRARLSAHLHHRRGTVFHLLADALRLCLIRRHRRRTVPFLPCFARSTRD